MERQRSKKKTTKNKQTNQPTKVKTCSVALFYFIFCYYISDALPTTTDAKSISFVLILSQSCQFEFACHELYFSYFDGAERIWLSNSNSVELQVSWLFSRFLSRVLIQGPVSSTGTVQGASMCWCLQAEMPLVGVYSQYKQLVSLVVTNFCCLSVYLLVTDCCLEINYSKRQSGQSI